MSSIFVTDSQSILKCLNFCIEKVVFTFRIILELVAISRNNIIIRINLLGQLLPPPIHLQLVCCITLLWHQANIPSRNRIYEWEKDEQMKKSMKTEYSNQKVSYPWTHVHCPAKIGLVHNCQGQIYFLTSVGNDQLATL